MGNHYKFYTEARRNCILEERCVSGSHLGESGGVVRTNWESLGVRQHVEHILWGTVLAFASCPFFLLCVCGCPLAVELSILSSCNPRWGLVGARAESCQLELASFQPNILAQEWSHISEHAPADVSCMGRWWLVVRWVAEVEYLLLGYVWWVLNTFSSNPFSLIHRNGAEFCVVILYQQPC